MIGQTWALFVDAYRELNSRKLFWIVLLISVLFAGAFAAVGINEKGLTVLWWEFEVPILSTQTLGSEAFFYKFLFFSLGFKIWLTWAATILALISTASIIPDFVAGGAVELALSKPIGRLRLFVTKYLTGLMFVAAQVSLFTIASFLVIGLRGGEWAPVLFWAIPLVVLFFSYLYAVSALVGLLTRSAIASLLSAICFWFVIFMAQATETVFLQFRTTEDVAVAVLQGERASLEEKIAATVSEPDGEAKAAPLQAELADVERRLEEGEESQRWWNRTHSIGYAVITVLPKTEGTMSLLERELISISDMNRFANAAEPSEFPQTSRVHGVRVSQRQVQTRMAEELRERNAAWVLGTSLTFELVVLGAAAWIFCRRDF